ncbi:MAG: hypothetical protein JSW55_16090 [Chloroflexota bacterium]|nr:MAG: hypothetical protein JSW55_16090 [Chloroflexota bacterium]
MGLSGSTKPDETLSGLHPATRGDESPAVNRLWWTVPIAVAGATIANVIFYFILTRWLGEPLLMIEQFPPPEMVPMPVGEVILVSIIWALAASLVYVFLSEMTAWPDRNFIIISAVVLLASLALPFKAPTPPVAMSAKLSLAAMHLIGAVVVVGSLVGLNSKRPRSGRID